MAGADVGGISEVVLNYYRFIDRSRIHFDIAFTTEAKGKNADALRELGAGILRLPLKSEGIRRFENSLLELLEKNHYDCVHVHENETSYVALKAAKKAGVPQRIAHSHTSSPFVSLKGEIRRLSGCVLNTVFATKLIGCGQLAGERVFGKLAMRTSKAVVLPNAIDLSAFSYSEEVRAQVRSEEGFDGRYVIGMVGRLSPEKNHQYALHLMEKIAAVNPSALLVIVGNGDDEAMICEQIEAKKLQSHVKMLGRRKDVHRLCQGFDALCMPSYHEGFPVAAVEALASGLPLVLSDTITKELAFSGRTKYIRLNNDAAWVDALLNTADASACRENGYQELKDQCLDIRDAAKLLETIYLKKHKEHCPQ